MQTFTLSVYSHLWHVVKIADSDPGFPSSDWFGLDFLSANVTNVVYPTSTIYAGYSKSEAKADLNLQH